MSNNIINKNTNNQTEECCPRFDPEPWDNKEFVWENKLFIKDKVWTIFYMPLNYGKVMTRLTQKVEEAGAQTPDNLCLTDNTSKWNMDLYLAVDKEVPNAENTTLSGKFLSKVYEGNYEKTGSWMQDFENYVREKGISVKKTFMWYTTCPKCAKKYGKNYVVLVGEIS